MRKRNGMLLCVLVLLVILLAVGFPTSFTMAGYTPVSASFLTHSAQGKPAPLAPDKEAEEVRPFIAQAAHKLLLNIARRNHTATPLADGRVLIVGGDNLEGAVGATELLDPAAAKLVLTGKLLIPRARHTATLLPSGKVLVSGGANEMGALDSTELFDPQTGTFANGPKLQRARAGHSATLLPNGQVLLAGGQADDTAEVYDPATNRSAPIQSNLTGVRYGHSAILLKNGSVLLVGGEEGNGHNLESAEIFNPGTASFSATANALTIPRARAVLRALPDGKVQVIGGDYDGTLEVYDPLNGRFGAVAHLVPTADIFSPAEMVGVQTRAGFMDGLSYRDATIKRVAPQSLNARIESFVQGLGRKRYAMTELPGSNQVVIAGGVGDNKKLDGSVLLLKSYAATISTNQVEYLPGDAPVISGSGWQPFEKITIVRQEARLGHKRRTLEAVADKRGDFSCTDLSADDYRVWTTYTLTAKGETSGQIAQTSYIDAPVPGKETESLGKVSLKFPLVMRDGSVETDKALLKWKVNTPFRAGDDLQQMTTMATCTIPNGNTFNLTPDFSGVNNQPCLGIAGNPCGINDIRFKDICLAMSGTVEATTDLMADFPFVYATARIQEDFKAAGTMLFDMKNGFNLNLLNIPIPALSVAAVIPSTSIGVTAGLSVRAKISTAVTTHTTIEVPFEFSQGHEYSFDTRNDPAGTDQVTTPSVATGDVVVAKPGTASAKFSLGPNLGVKLAAGITLVDFGVGILGFIEPSLTNPTDTETCKKGNVDLHAGIEGNATAKLIPIPDVFDGINISSSLPFFSQQIPGFPKDYFTADTGAPVITQGDITQTIDLSTCGANISFTPSITDDCSGVDPSSIQVSSPSGTLFPLGQTTVTVNAKDLAGNPATHSFKVTVTCPTITLPAGPLPAGQASTFYSQSLAALPVAGYAYSVSAGTLPPGLSLNPSTGLLSGTLTQAGNFNFTVLAAACGCSTSMAYSINVTCPTITHSALPNAVAGTVYNQTIGATPASAYSFAVTAGALPPGLALNATTGALTGTLTTAGTFNFTVTATGFGICTKEQNYSLVISCPTITLAALPNAVAGTVYNQNIVAAPPGGAYSFVVTAGALPPGLTLNAATGAVTGTLTTAGTFNFTVTATGFGICAKEQVYSLVIACPTITLSSLPEAIAGIAYTQMIVASPAGGAYAFALTAGSLPPGLMFNAATGAVTGTPTTAGIFRFTIKVTGFGNCMQSAEYVLTVVCPTLTLTPTVLPNGVQGTVYNQTLIAAPTGTTYTYAVTTNILPPGLSLNNATGVISGTPSAPGNYTFVVTAAGWGTCTKSQSYNLTITGTCPTITVNPAVLPGSAVGTAYNQTVSATGGTAPYSFALTQGVLPQGLTLNAATGVISGTPTAGGTVSFRITATGQGGCASSRQYVMNSTCATLAFEPSTAALPSATRGVAYSQAITVTPAANYSFTLLLGQLPPGFTLNPLTGVISGITSQTGQYSFTLKVLGGSCQTTKSYTLAVTAGLTALAQQADYDGDGKSDFALSSGQGVWKLLLSNSAQRGTQTLSWGAAGDVSLLGDYDGDGRTDLAVFRPSKGSWHIQRSSDGSALVKAWGVATDVPVQGDYDGDGKTDLAVFRPGEGNWYVLRSSDEQYQVTAWGAGSASYHDVAVPGDYDGDGRTDLAVFRRATGTWFVKRSSDGQAFVKQWGLGTDGVVAADYDGDGQTDLAVWRQGTWYIWQSKTASHRIEQWGTSAAPYYDQAVPGDYDGDGQTDLAVWRTSEQTWYVRCSLTGNVVVQAQGLSGDRAVAVKP